MTTYATRPMTDEIPSAPTRTSKGRLAVKILTTTDHKTIGYLYLATSFAWFLIGGILALHLAQETFSISAAIGFLSLFLHHTPKAMTDLFQVHIWNLEILDMMP